jgi:hypothetical protein
MRHEARQRVGFGAIRRLQREIGSLGSDFERIGSIFHLRFTLGEDCFITQEEKVKYCEKQLSCSSPI